MKIIEAVWEKRNLGVDTLEIIIEKHDNKKSLIEIEHIIKNYSYIVVKVPNYIPEINKYLSEEKYLFIESSIHMKINPKFAKLTNIEERINSFTSYSEMNNTEFDELYQEIQKGIFCTDRIVLDNHFSKEIAAKRYINWIKDELDLGSQIFNIIYKNEKIGFFIIKKLSSKIYYNFLGGIYRSYEKPGLGFLIARKAIDYSQLHSSAELQGVVSSNNISIININIQQGFKVNKIWNVFVKHSEAT